MNKHTPGPWVVDETHLQGSVNNLEIGRHITLCSLNVGRDQCLANARLIAAAPDMLEALIDCRRALELANFTGELAVVDAAIARATGEQP